MKLSHRLLLPAFMIMLYGCGGDGSGSTPNSGSANNTQAANEYLLGDLTGKTFSFTVLESGANGVSEGATIEYAFDAQGQAFGVNPDTNISYTPGSYSYNISAASVTLDYSNLYGSGAEEVYTLLPENCNSGFYELSSSIPSANIFNVEASGYYKIKGFACTEGGVPGYCETNNQVTLFNTEENDYSCSEAVLNTQCVEQELSSSETLFAYWHEHSNCEDLGYTQETATPEQFNSPEGPEVPGVNGYFANPNQFGTGINGPQTANITTIDVSAQTLGNKVLIYGNNTWLTAGDNGIYTSDDLATWTMQSSYSFRDAVFAENTFVVVGGSGRIFVSADGFNWQEITINSINFSRVRYFNGSFWAVPSFSGGVYRSDNGYSWEQFTEESFYDFAYHDGVYVGMGYRQVMTSTDGVEWTVTLAAGDIPSNVTMLAMEVYQGIFIAMTSRNFYTSNDGTNWSEMERVSDQPYAMHSGIMYVYDGKLATIINYSDDNLGNAVAMTSDGDTWIIRGLAISVADIGAKYLGFDGTTLAVLIHTESQTVGEIVTLSINEFIE